MTANVKKSILIFAVFFGVLPSLVLGAVDPTQQLAQGAVKMFAFLLGLSIILSALVVVIGITMVILSFVKGSWREDGKDWIKSGVTGLLITLLSWLILTTINPGLFNFKLYQLPEIVFKNGISQIISPTLQPKIANYQEIPVGTADENLLTKKIDCYDFDMYGDPLPGTAIKTDDGNQILGPTYLNHDRVDCYLKLSEAAEKKAAVIENLSQQIVSLMNQCSCQNRCNDPCNADGQGCSNAPVGGNCSNNKCAGAACQIPDGLQNFLNNSGQTTDLSCCPDNVKNQIKGYINTPGDGKGKVQPIRVNLKIACSTQGGCQDSFGKDYYGLSEFNPGKTNQTAISNLVEKQTKFEKEDLTYIDLDSCPSCIGVDSKSIKQCQNQRQQCLKKTPWGQLNLYEQLSYLKEKMQQIQDAIAADKKDLQKQSDSLESCVTPKSAVDLANTDQMLNKDQVLLNINKSSDDSSKYCQGFTYADSQISQQCNDACPITKSDLSCYGSCANGFQCNQTTQSPQAYQQCLQQKNTCLNQCDQNRKCTYNPQFSNYGACMKQGKQSCLSLCQAKYLSCSDEFQTCQSMCQNDSSCLQNNLEACVLNPAAMANCQNLPDDQVQNCINDSYKCQYGSQQNAGYADCVKSPTTQANFSASYLYQNPTVQVCPNAYQINPTNNQFCVENNPATLKCPASSQCPSCPCGSVSSTGTFGFEKAIPPQPEVNVCQGFASPPQTSCETLSWGTVKEFRIVGPECSKMAFNGDPLTFYCRQDWWNEPETAREKNLGSKYDEPQKNITCSSGDEVPVGMLVDASLKWADDTNQKMKQILDPVTNLLNYMTKLSQAKNYCSCSSTYENGDPVCRSCCNYVDPQDGSAPSCQFQSCGGNSCQQMIDWLYMMVNYHRDIRASFINVWLDFIAEPRTDILKMLTYARTKVDEFSSEENQKGKQNNILLSCQQILDNIVYPITDQNSKITIDQQQIYHYCYGQLSGKLLNASAQYENWFGCKTTQQISPEEQQEDNQKQQQLYYDLAQ